MSKLTSECDDMDIDSGVSDMTETESLSSVTSDSTIIGSPPSSVMGDSEVRGAENHFTLVNDAASNSSVVSPDSGIGSGSGSGNGMKLGEPLPFERKDPQTSTQEWVERHFEVFVKTLDGKTLTIQVEEHEEVTSFRKKVQEKTNVDASQHYFHTADGKKLEDGERLSKYDIKKHSTIFCQGRLRGGEYI
ncbi:uncharacterized protein LOC129922685 [Biomphalaria glabrata]|uniref:Uncharacterized protein LOC129922685 n=1 Tax=Biomphalaria glabrata TaxID=6526 RepID=A0A9W2YRN6_BIOGL|nr:uncharacterized protein LOC129922685 [Biomphalaria glabrata]XP_055865436.1 uncharacterized protein LOC129922685 [Biomphalaria glabrata]KAI8779912.1 ubiquitin protein ISG15 isoform X2 [Biomphalaria glabrata]